MAPRNLATGTWTSPARACTGGGAGYAPPNRITPWTSNIGRGPFGGKRQVRVLLYSRVFPPAVGGMERFAANLAQWLAEEGHDVTVATHTLADPGSVSANYHVLRRPSVGALVAAARRADVVHVNGLALRAVLPVVAARHRAVVTHQGHQAICPTGLAWMNGAWCSAGPAPGPCTVCGGRGVLGRGKVAAHRAGAHAASRNVCVSRYLQGRLRLSTSLFIYNPVARRVASSPLSSSADTLVAFAGRLVSEKGLDLLLRALKLAPAARLEVAGDGPLRAEWQRLAEAMEVGGRVTFRGTLSADGVAELYNRAALVCVPSLWDEPFGYAAAEAMALGKAVVATPRGALPELLGAGRGFVATDGTPVALAASLRQALEDRDARERAGLLAREFAERELSIDVIGPRYLRVYEEAAA